MKKYYLLIILGLIIEFSFSQELPKKHLPAYQTKEELQKKTDTSSPIFYPRNIKKNFTNMVVPGEFEELQAVLITWPYPGTSTDSYSILWGKLINAIQKECPVWILVDKYSDTIKLKSYLGAQNVTLKNYKFYSKQTDAFWTRDFGPWGFYYSNKDSLGFVDLKYYSSRPNDDAVPGFLAGKLNIPYYTTKVKMEGGNFMTDGFGHGFYSSRVIENNSPWTSKQTQDTVKKIFNLKAYNVLNTLQCDGGTGHIDMYSKLMDEQTLVISQYPGGVTAQDRQIIENNVKVYEGLKTTYNRPFKIFRAPYPKSNTGNYYTTCSQINSDARGYVNGLMVNKTFLMPCYSSNNSSYVKSDTDAVRFFRKVLPGYKIVPIDSRLLTPMGGAIHCITMQIPANNPIRFWHPTVDGLKKRSETYHILSKISNKDGIDSAYCHWKYRGSSQWNKFLLQDSSGYFTGEIINTSNLIKDTIIYYLSAKSNNGKRMTKPITAPYGYYKFWYADSSSYISGTVTYDNVANSPIAGAKVILRDNLNEKIDSVISDSEGLFKFTGLKNGNYYIEASYNGSVKGVNPTDALLISKYYVSSYTFNDDLKELAADVNTDSFINSTDALLTLRRYLQIITDFPFGNWISEKKMITISENNIVQDIKIICKGDVDGSY